jgi:hypothetical protein
MHFDHNPSFLQPSSSHIWQSHILNKVQYPADRDVTVTWFHKVMDDPGAWILIWPNPHSHKKHMWLFQMSPCICHRRTSIAAVGVVFITPNIARQAKFCHLLLFVLLTLYLTLGNQTWSHRSVQVWSPCRCSAPPRVSDLRYYQMFHYSSTKPCRLYSSPFSDMRSMSVPLKNKSNVLDL